MERFRRLLAALLVGVALMPTLAPVRLFPRQATAGLFPRETLRPYTSVGGATPGLDGTVFLPDELTGARLVVRAAFGADPSTPPGSWTYTDITSDVLQDSGRTISIRVGRVNWKTTSQPATLTLGLKNPAGKYTANNALSPLWPYLTQGVPIQVQLWIAGQYWDRFDGESVGWKPVLDSTGNWSTVTLTAAGTLRRIGGGSTQPPPLHSASYRAITRVATPPVAYWPMEDGTGATQALSALPGGQPLTVTSGRVSFAGTSGPDGSGSVVDFSAGGTLFGSIPSTGFVDRVRLEFAIQFPTIAAGKICEAISFQFAPTGNIDAVQINAGPLGEGALQYILAYNDGTAAGLVFTSGDVNDGEWHWVQLDLTKSGSSVIGVLRLDGTTIDTSTYTATTLGAPVSVIMDEAPQPDSIYPAIGHTAVWYTLPDYTITYDAFTGHAGETVSDRLVRLCAQENIPFTLAGGTVDPTTMGPQRVDTLINLLRECEATGAGLLYDGPGAPGLTYQGLDHRYNAGALLTLDASAGQVQPPFGIEDDDFERVNLSTVTTRDGSRATYEDSTGPLGTGRIPTYSGTPPTAPNYYSADPLRLRAAWEVHKGTVPGFRYPSITVNWRKIPTKIPAWLQALPGWPLTITPPYAGILPTGDIALVIEGYQEDIAKLQWTVTAFTSRGEPYQVGRIGDGITRASARVASAASTVASDVTAGASSISVAVTSGPLWTTDSAYYPQDFWVDGLRVTVTAMAGSSSPQTATVDPGDVTRAIPAGRTVHPWVPIEASL